MCQVVVGAPSEVEEIFDAISYFKGAAVIRMLHRWIGDDVSVCLCIKHVCKYSVSYTWHVNRPLGRE